MMRALIAHGRADRSRGRPAGGGPVGHRARRLARRRIEDVWRDMNERLADGRPYLIGDRVSTVDFLATMLMRWSRAMPHPATSWPRLGDYIHRMRSRPAYLALHRLEGLEGWTNEDESIVR
jgi:glutathione S-transferase